MTFTAYRRESSSDFFSDSFRPCCYSRSPARQPCGQDRRAWQCGQRAGRTDGRRHVNGAANIRAFGAVSSASILSCIADRGSPKLNCSNPGDYINGQYVFVPGGGATPQGALADGPDNLSVTSTRSIGGGAQLSTVSRTYEVTRVDFALGESAATLPVTVTDGSIMLGGDAWADVEWTCDSHALGYRVYGCQGAGCEPRFLGWVKQPTHVQVCGYDDMGFADASEMVAVGPNQLQPGRIAEPCSASRSFREVRIYSISAAPPIPLFARQ